MGNPLLSDRDVEFLLYEVLNVTSLCELEGFDEHSRETFDLFLASARRLARGALYPAYRAMDSEPLLRGTILDMLQSFRPEAWPAPLPSTEEPSE